jgi:hypothetical protein
VIALGEIDVSPLKKVKIEVAAAGTDSVADSATSVSVESFDDLATHTTMESAATPDELFKIEREVIRTLLSAPHQRAYTAQSLGMHLHKLMPSLVNKRTRDGLIAILKRIAVVHSAQNYVVLKAAIVDQAKANAVLVPFSLKGV